MLLTREENQVQIFPSSLRISSIDEAQKKLQKQPIHEEYRRQLLLLIDALISANSDEGISTDELMGVSGLSPEKVRTALYDLEKLVISSNDTALTAFLNAGVENSSRSRLEQASQLELGLIAELRESAPDLDKGEQSALHLRVATQHLKDKGLTYALPEKLRRIIKGLSMDGRNEDSSAGSLRTKRLDAETIQITLQREWPALEKTAKIRQAAAERILDHLLSCLPQGSKGADLLAETTLGKLLSFIEGDMFLKSEVKDPSKLLDRALMWMHELEVIRLNKGLAVFRPAMTIHLGQEKRGFAKSDFAPLKMHYDEQVIQIHVMAEYAQRGLEAMTDSLKLAMEYFSLGQEEFLKKWLPISEKELSRQTTPESWRNIVESLHNPIQQKIVADDREQTNVLVLAGPGSGKTKVLVHRIAYLVRVKRENPHGIIALAYNRHAAVEIRRRLFNIIGDDAKGITVMTCHALAMRLVGASFTEKKFLEDSSKFKLVLQQATALLRGDGLAAEDADEQRERLLAGFRWILVDEYQDVGPDQYDLISALAGRTQSEEDGKLSLFAVGDDDQNIYSFDGASVEFIRKFESDYEAKPSFLTENYRSTANIINASNLIISPAPQRMKVENPITINRARKLDKSGGEYEMLDKVSMGKVQILPVGDNSLSQAVAVMTELQRLSKLSSDWTWMTTAVIAREWKFLEPIRAYCELHNIPVQMADEDTNSFWRLRETQALVEWIRTNKFKLIDAPQILSWIHNQDAGPWWTLLCEAIDAYLVETSGAELPTSHFFEWLAEWGREIRRRQTGIILLTAHRAKGLEFDHVAVLDGAWEKRGRNEDVDSSRRLYYVAMTRARKTLLLAHLNSANTLIDNIPENNAIFRRQTMPLPAMPPELLRQYIRIGFKDVDLGFAGRHQEGHPIHHSINEIKTGDSIEIKQTNGQWEIVDLKGTIVGRLSRAFRPPENLHFISGRVMAIICRQLEDSEPEYRNSVRCNNWEVILPELVFTPD